MSNIPAGVDPLDWRRFVKACEEERLRPHPVTPEEFSQVEALTIGERINFPLIAELCGRDYAEDMRARLRM